MSTVAELAWLARLHDITEPPTPGLWPLAPGWWLVALLFVLLLLRGGQWGWRRWRATAYRRQALRALAQCPAADVANAAEHVSICVRLLRQASAALAPEPPVPAAQGAAWVAWLHARCPSAHPCARVQQLLCEGAYCPPQRISPDDAAALRAFTRRWLQEHHA